MLDIPFNSVLIFIGTTNNKLVIQMALCFYILEGVVFLYLLQKIAIIVCICVIFFQRFFKVVSQLVRKICKIDWSFWLLLEY